MSSYTPTLYDQIEAALVAAHKPVTRILIYIGAGSDAEDIYHDVVVRIMSDPVGYLGHLLPSEWTSYLVACARNKFLDLKRNNRRLVSADSEPGKDPIENIPARQSDPLDRELDDFNWEALSCYRDLCSGPGAPLAEALWELAPRYGCISPVDRLHFLTTFIELKMGRSFDLKRKEIASELPYSLARRNGALRKALDQARPCWIARRRR